MDNTRSSVGLTYRQALVALIFVSLGYGFANFHRNSMAILSPYLASSYDLSTYQLGILGSMMYYTYGLCQIPVGIIADKFGSRLVLRVCAVLLVVGALSFALSANFLMLCISRLVLGVAVSGFFVPGLSLIREWFDHKQVGFFTSVMVSLGNIFTIMSYSPFQLVLDNFSIRSIYIGIGALSLVVGLGIFMIPRSRTSVPADSLEKTKAPRSEFNFILAFSIFGLVFVGSRQAYQSQWATAYYTQNFGLSLETSSHILMLATIGGIIFGPISGRIADTKGTYETFFALGLATVASWIVLAFLPAFSPFVLILVVAVIYGALSTVTMSIAFTVLGDYIDPKIRTLSNGILNSFNFFGAGIFIQAIGYILSGLSLGENIFRPIYLFFAISIGLCLLLIYRVHLSMPRPWEESH